MHDLDEGSGSEEENFQSRSKKAQRGLGTASGKASKAAVAEEDGPA